MLRPVRLRRRLTSVLTAAFVGCGLSFLAAPPAAADAIGYVRPAHLFVIDRPSGLSADLRSDALRAGAVPAGGVETGAGGGGRPGGTLVVLAAVVALLGVGAALVSTRTGPGTGR